MEKTHKKEKSKLTTLCYIERDGAYLMLHRIKKEQDVNRDKWIGVGGHFEQGESPEECLLREVKEETGLTLTRWRFRGIVTFCFQKPELPEQGTTSNLPKIPERSRTPELSGIPKLSEASELSGGLESLEGGEGAEPPICEYMCLYTADGFEGELSDCNEGTLEWVPKEKRKDLEMWEGDRIFFRLLEEDAPFFSLKLGYIGDDLREAILDGKPLF